MYKVIKHFQILLFIAVVYFQYSSHKTEEYLGENSILGFSFFLIVPLLFMITVSLLNIKTIYFKEKESVVLDTDVVQRKRIRETRNRLIIVLICTVLLSPFFFFEFQSVYDIYIEFLKDTTGNLKWHVLLISQLLLLSFIICLVSIMLDIIVIKKMNKDLK